MSLINELNALGVDTEDALKRFMNNAPLYERMLGKLPENIRKLEVLPFFEAQDYQKALENAHTLKGVTGNLSLTPLYRAYADIVSLLRTNQPEKARNVLEEILPVQAQIVSCIEKHQ